MPDLWSLSLIHICGGILQQPSDSVKDGEGGFHSLLQTKQTELPLKTGSNCLDKIFAV